VHTAASAHIVIFFFFVSPHYYLSARSNFSSLMNWDFFLSSILFSLRRLLWHPVWKSWRSAALPYGTYDPLHVESTQS